VSGTTESESDRAGGSTSREMVPVRFSWTTSTAPYSSTLSSYVEVFSSNVRLVVIVCSRRPAYSW
jgi:hypothetical protein